MHLLACYIIVIPFLDLLLAQMHHLIVAEVVVTAEL